MLTSGRGRSLDAARPTSLTRDFCEPRNRSRYATDPLLRLQFDGRKCCPACPLRAVLRNKAHLLSFVSASACLLRLCNPNMRASCRVKSNWRSQAQRAWSEVSPFASRWRVRDDERHSRGGVITCCRRAYIARTLSPRQLTSRLPTCSLPRNARAEVCQRM